MGNGLPMKSVLNQFFWDIFVLHHISMTLHFFFLLFFLLFVSYSTSLRFKYFNSQMFQMVKAQKFYFYKKMWWESGMISQVSTLSDIWSIKKEGSNFKEFLEYKIVYAFLTLHFRYFEIDIKNLHNFWQLHFMDHQQFYESRFAPDDDDVILDEREIHLLYTNCCARPC